MASSTPNADKVYRVANAEVGYAEGPNNYNKYAAFVGVPNNDAWCCTFASWIMKTAGFESLAPMVDYSVDAYNWYHSRGRSSEYPALGAEVYYGPGGGDHVGWCYAYDADFIYTIEGNWHNQVSKVKRPRREPLDGMDIFAYGLPAYPEGIVTADPAHPVAGSRYQATGSLTLEVPAPAPPPPPAPAPAPYKPPPFPAGIAPDQSSPSAKTLQKALKVHGYLGASVALSDNYGPLTQAAVKAFYTAHQPQFTPDTAIGPKGWAVLFTEAYGAAHVAAPAVAEPAMDMTRTTYGGKTVNQRTKVLLQRAAESFGEAFTLVQGSYHPGVAASAGTHDGGGVVDVSVDGMSTDAHWRALRALRAAGFAAWFRTPDDGFDYHIHACAVGDADMAPLAKDQVHSYFDGRNGLANNGSDNAPASVGRPYPAWAAKYK